MDFWWQGGRPCMVKTELSLDTCCKIRGFGGFEISWKIDAKMPSKIDEHRSHGRPRAGLLGFVEVFGGAWCFVFSWSGKKSVKNPEKSNILVQRIKFSGFWIGPAECAVPLEREGEAKTSPVLASLRSEVQESDFYSLTRIPPGQGS